MKQFFVQVLICLFVSTTMHLIRLLPSGALTLDFSFSSISATISLQIAHKLYAFECHKHEALTSSLLSCSQLASIILKNPCLMVVVQYLGHHFSERNCLKILAKILD